MSPSLPDHVLAQAPRRWVSLGNGMRVKVIDPDWRKQQEALSELREQREAEREERRRRAGLVYRDWAMSCLSVGVLSSRSGEKESFDVVVQDVLDNHGCVTLAEIKGPLRNVDITNARQHLMYEVRRRCHATLPQIGRILNRDHSTVLHAIREWPRKAAKLGIHVHPLGRERSGE